MFRRYLLVTIICSIFSFLPISSHFPWAADTTGSTAKVAVLPFAMHTPGQLAYLQDGVRDMLTSRLAWQGKVQVMDRTAVEQAVKGSKSSDLSVEDALRIGKSLKADFVLFGSITGVGQSVSIDAKMLRVAGTSDPVSLYAQTKSLDEVIPRINQFAQEINQKVFSRPSEQTQTAMTETDAAGTRNPELLVPETMIAGDKISYLNPNFVEMTPEGSIRQPGLWRSQTFQGGIIGMDIGDLDGDGRSEMVVATQDKISAYKREGQALKPIGTFDGTNVDRFLWVSVADVNRDGVSEIYVTNLRRKNSTRAPLSEQIIGGNATDSDDLASFALTLSGGRLQPTGANAPYFLNAVDFGERGKVLLGQEKGQITEGPFKPNIYEMQLRGGSIEALSPANLPSQCNVYNFARADINSDHADETIVIDKSNILRIYSNSGDQLWKSDKQFAATTNGFEGKVEDRRFNSVEIYSLPSPILITDLNKDGIPEIVVTRSLDIMARFMPEGLKKYDRGEIVSLSWDQLGLVENWKTREISGMVTSVRLADMNNDGTTELLASLVLAKDFMKLWDSKSTVFGYDLNVSQAKTASREAEKPVKR